MASPAVSLITCPFCQLIAFHVNLSFEREASIEIKPMELQGSASSLVLPIPVYFCLHEHNRLIGLPMALCIPISIATSLPRIMFSMGILELYHTATSKKTTISFKRDVASRCGLSVSNLKCTKAHKFTTPFFVVQSAIFLIKFVIDLQVYNSTSSIDCIRCKSQFVLVSQCTTARSFSNYIFLSDSSEFLKK